VSDVEIFLPKTSNWINFGGRSRRNP